jgi:hypothetical protein
MYIKYGSFQNLLSGAPQPMKKGLYGEKARKALTKDPYHFNYLKENKISTGRQLF